MALSRSLSASRSDPLTAFATAAIRLLTDDALWLRFHQTSLERQGQWTWQVAAAHFESLMD